jgi:RND family efflux transporter MFP subunit
VKLNAKALAPVGVLVAAIAVMVGMIAGRQTVESNRPTRVPPLVRVIRAEPAPVQLNVSAQGTVEPRTESDLVTEVSGRIVWVSQQLAAGGFFDEGDLLVRIDPRDYEVALEGALAALARAESNRVHANSELRRQRSMRQSGASSKSSLGDAVFSQASAEAGVREARVAVRRAELDLERTEIRSPFAGRVREKHVDVGQFMGRGATIARVYSIDYAEVRLPISDADLAYLDLPLGYNGQSAAASDAAPSFDGAAELGDSASPQPKSVDSLPEASTGPEVELFAEYAGERFSWPGHVVRTEGALDPRTRMINIVARVDDPYGRNKSASPQPPLPVGLFVEAAIEGRQVEDVYEVPRSALRRRNQVMVVDAEDRIHFREVVVLRSHRERSWIRSGLEPGERLVVSPLETATDGMKVRTVEATAQDGASSSSRQDGRPS